MPWHVSVHTQSYENTEGLFVARGSQI